MLLLLFGKFKKNIESKLQKISDDTEHIIREYISINSMFRSEPAPNYWTKDGSNLKDKHYVLENEKSDPKKVFPDLAQIYLDNNQIEEETNKFNQSIVEESNTYQAELNAYKTEIDSEIEKIREEYKVE